MANLIVLPAQGKLYHTVKEALEDWDSGKDFRAFPGEFILSKRDIKSARSLYEKAFLKIPNLGGLKLQIF